MTHAAENIPAAWYEDLYDVFLQSLSDTHIVGMLASASDAHGAYFNFLSDWSYVGLFSILLAAGFGFPMPEDIPLIVSGYLVRESHGDLTTPLLLMCLTGLAGVMAGDSALFFLGRRYGPAIVEKRWFRRIAKPWLIERARQKYEHHGAKILFAGRFMPGLRCVLFLTAGVFRVPYWKMLAFDGSAAAISIPLLVWLGWYFHTHINAVFTSAKVATIVIGSLVAVALLVWIVYEYKHNLSIKGREIPADPHAGAELLSEASAVLGNLKQDEEIGKAMIESAAAVECKKTKPPNPQPAGSSAE